MASSQVKGQSGEGFRFGDFEYDPQRRQLRKHGTRIRIQRQPLAILLTLVKAGGSVVTRQQLREIVWEPGTFVSFEDGLNSAIKRLRTALCESADEPRFIETLPGIGYRFIAKVAVISPPTIAAETQTVPPATEIAHVPTAPSAQPKPVRRLLWKAAAVAAVCGAMLITISSVSWRRSGADLHFNSNDWVLATFENRTGNSSLDGALQAALERELNNSHFVHVVPRERLHDVLSLMRSPAETHVDENLAREICLRDGGIKLLLAGRVEMLGPTYVLSVSVIDPRNGATLHSVTAQASEDGQILPAIHRAGNDLRQALGEEAAQINATDLALQKVTTPSLEALRLFSAGYELQQLLIADDQNAGLQALSFFQKAVEVDPDFATAWVHLGWALRNQRRSGPETKAAFQRALDLADHATEREQLFIRQSWAAINGHQQDALGYGALLVRLYPDHFWGANNFGYNLLDAGENAQAATAFKHCLDLRRSFLGAIHYWEQLYGADEEIGRDFASTVTAIAARDHSPEAAFWLPYIAATEAWQRGDARAALAQLDSAQLQPTLDPGYAHMKSAAYSALGRLRAAEDLPLGTPYPENLQMMASFLRNGVSGLASYAAEHPAPPVDHGLRTLLYARVGIVGSRRLVAERPQEMRGEWQHALRGELAMNRGNYKVAARELALAYQQQANSWPARMFMADSLATALEKTGDPQAAIAVLRRFSDARGWALMHLGFWPLVEQHLANLYRQTGEAARADTIEKKVMSMLTAADADYSLAAQLLGSPSAHNQSPR